MTTIRGIYLTVKKIVVFYLYKILKVTLWNVSVFIITYQLRIWKKHVLLLYLIYCIQRVCKNYLY